MFDTIAGPPPSFGGADPDAGGGAEAFDRQLTREDGQSLALAFDQCRGSHGYVSADAGKRQLEKKGLSNDILQTIWELSDLDRDGRLSLREFVCAMQLAEQARRGQPLPYTVTIEQQTAMVRAVEKWMPSINAGDHPEAAKPRMDDFSTANTGQAGNARTTTDGFNSVRGFESTGGSASAALLRGDGRQGLGQLASCLEAAARQDDGSLHQYVSDIFQVRQQLEEQLARRSDFERELREVDNAVGALSDELIVNEVKLVEVRQRVKHLKDEAEFLEGEIRSAEMEVAELRDVTGINVRDYPTDPVLGHMSEQQQLRHDHMNIIEHRKQLEGRIGEKKRLQAEQHALVEQQRQIEQDRGLTLTAIEAERVKLANNRQMRLKMQEEKNALIHELREHASPEAMADILRSVAASATVAMTAPTSAAVVARPPPTSAAGVRRADHRGVRHDAPSALLAT